ncbi:MAG: hypothetical protein M1840_004308 [Geoglossum simile]|nr:MAG: hypothetical protein M1840_004308 [Geoglossum simile]
MDGPPPPPPPHGTTPKSAGLPPGNYDIFVIPPHSSGSGFLYLPSLQPQRNSFLAGVGCTLVTVLVLQIVTPVLREWLATIMATGGSGVVMLVLGVGIAGWAWGRSQAEPPTPDPGGRGFGGGNMGGSHEQTNRNPPHGSPGGHPRDTSGAAGTPPDDNSGGTAGGPGGGTAGGAGARPKPTWQQRQDAGSTGPGNTGGGTARGEWNGAGTASGGASGAGTGRGGWEKAREETRRKEEERRKREEDKRGQDEERRRKAEEERRAKEAAERERWERARTREREAREREVREREAREREAKEREAREREAREREAREKEVREREAREKEAKEREAREKEAREKREREEKERQNRERAEREKQEREKRDKERREREQQEKAKKDRISTTYAVTVGEKTNPYSRTTVPVTPTFKAPDAPPSSTNARKTNGSSPIKVPPSPTRPPPSPTKRHETPTKAYLGPDDDMHSFRPYDRPKQHFRKESPHSSVCSESSYAPSQSTARTSPPPSQRGSYSTKDPDKIVIKAVYSFNNAFVKLPTAQLISGVGSVTDGLVLKITTEGLFIDDDVRGVPQREWDIKAWTMKTVEIWCPQFWASGASSGSSTSAGQHRNPVRRLFIDGKGTPPSSEETDLLLESLLRLCNSNCSMTDSRGVRGRAPNCVSQNGDFKGLHVLRASIRDQEGKKYVFVLEEEEGWKVAVGLQRLRRGTQVRAMGVGGVGKEETRALLENLGWD